MKRLVFFLSLLALMAFAQKDAWPGTQEVCTECFRECNKLLSLYEEFFRKGTEDDPHENEEIKKATDILNRCLRYYGARGVEADDVVRWVREEAEKRKTVK